MNPEPFKWRQESAHLNEGDTRQIKKFDKTVCPVCMRKSHWKQASIDLFGQVTFAWEKLPDCPGPYELAPGERSDNID